MVDERGRSVPPGVIGAKLLVTVLFSRTQPLIRYEMSYRVGRALDACDCGLPFGLLSTIEGRAEDVLDLGVSVHPNVFHRVLEPLPVREWQVLQEPERLHVLLGSPHAAIATDQVARAIAQELARVGATPPRIDVEVVDAVTRTALGKAPLVKALSMPT
jgi:phenylacetate-coenzyme A ligase PaaK-like adenylate-forming protein